MAQAPETEPCPFCGETVSVRAEVCPHCHEELFEEAPPRRSQEPQATDFLVPTNVSGWSILSCYMGLVGFCLPLVGLLFAIPAVIFGIVALYTRKKKAATYGSVTSDIRAIVGLILGGLAIVMNGAFFLMFILKL
jgi:hypothetical protein